MILVIIYFVFALLYSLSVKNKLENQIKFSIHPIADAQKILLIILAVMASSSVAFGYLNDAATRSFVIPPEVKTSVNKFIESKMDAGSEQVKIPEKDKKALAEKSKGEIEKMWTNLETRLKDGKNTIAIFLASAFFTILQLILIVFSFIPLLILRILFPLLKLIHVTRIVTETKEVEQLVL
ncbi:hypothetical protein HZC20_01880 [Candidatus Peregrinibacteria bacterium]|nr:hypothetical protein [Candidatus Peregrinibacteria bacterium]